jgi:hypothetical protein
MLPPPSDRTTGPDSARTALAWLRRLLVCNPFFLGSAALLLFGLNRLSVDPGFLEREESKLLFNFTALEGYEILVVATALLLSRRALWYDSTLLAVLDQGLALAPFLLVTQGVMIDPVLGTVLVASASLMAVSRIWAIRRGFPRFPLPGRLLMLGAGILVLNMGLPLRLQAVVRAGMVTDWEPYNDAFWCVALPLLILSAVSLPQADRHGILPPERPWLPLLVGGLWIGATGVHGWSCAYIGKQPMTAAYLAPAAAATAWVLVMRLGDFVRVPTRRLRLAAWAIASASPFLAFGHDRLFPALAAAGAAALARQAVLHRSEGPLLRAAAGLSALAALLALPLEWIQPATGIEGRGAWILATSGFLAVIASFLRCSARSGLVAGAFIGAGVLHWNRVSDGNLALQAGLAWIAVHSLFWKDGESRGQDGVRNAVLAVWILTAWNRPPSAIPSELVVDLVAASVLVTAWSWIAWHRGWTRLLQVPATAALLAVTTPGGWIVQHGPAGLLALAGSLVLFAGGCVLAWTRGRWER